MEKLQLIMNAVNIICKQMHVNKIVCDTLVVKVNQAQVLVNNIFLSKTLYRYMLGVIIR